jgi:hypothetical protein
MNVDHFFTIGSAHIAQGTPCEDYALSGELPKGAVFGVVADGCSGANANTDVGARAIAWAFKRSLERRAAEQGEWFSDGFFELLRGVFHEHQYAGAREDYLATLVGFAATPAHASVYIHGDGAVALAYKDGSIGLIQLSWWDNMPFYLAYHLHPDLLDQFTGRYQDGVIEPFAQKVTAFRKTGDAVEGPNSKVDRFTVDGVFNGHVLHFQPREENIVALAVLTDGIEQIGEKPALDVVNEFMAFKNHQGEFVKRRLLKALKTFRKDDLIPRDDVGMAAVWFAEEA